jgi:hypothetical protein
MEASDGSSAPVDQQQTTNSEVWQAGITTLTLVWDGTNLSANYGFLSHLDNEIRQNETKENGIFHLITQIDDSVLKSFQNEITKVMQFNKVQSVLKKTVTRLSPGKNLIFNTVAPFISGVKTVQLVMLISGRPGSGKAHLARIMCDYAYLLHGAPNGKYDTVVLNRHSRALCVLMKPTLSKNKVDSLKEHLKNTVLIILEDCNWFSLEAIMLLSSRLCEITGKSDVAFGGLNTVMFGDVKDSVMVLKKGTPMMQKSAPCTTDAIAGQNLLRENLTHFIDLSDPCCYPILDFSAKSIGETSYGSPFNFRQQASVNSLDQDNCYPEFLSACIKTARNKTVDVDSVCFV